MPINQTREMLENIFNGTSPVKRSNPKPGESAYYYLKPDANASTVNQMQKIDIPNQPNPQSQQYNYDTLLTNTIAHLKKEEGNPQHIYLDTKGYKTIGVGINVDDWNTFQKLNFMLNNRPATLEEKRQAFNIFENSKAQNRYGQKFGAEYFKDVSNLRITDDESNRLLNQHLQNTLQHVQTQFPNFQTFPQGLQNVLLDIAYNTGNIIRKKWPRLHAAIQTKSLPLIRSNIHRQDVPESRNSWAEQQIDSITSW